MHRHGQSSGVSGPHLDDTWARSPAPIPRGPRVALARLVPRCGDLAPDPGRRAQVRHDAGGQGTTRPRGRHGDHLHRADDLGRSATVAGIQLGREILRWELEGDGEDGCTLVFTHVFDGKEQAPDLGSGWQAALEIVEARLAGKEVTWSVWDRATELRDDYVAEIMEPMWPVSASEEHIAARTELAKAERALRDRVEEVAAARRRMPPGPELGEYPLTEGPADLGRQEPLRHTTLRELFGAHPTLVIYHLMFHPDDDEACPMCSMWVDGFHGVAHHLAQHTAFAVVAKAPLPKLRSWASRRGWDGLRILSSHGTTFNADLNAETADGHQRPMISVCTAEDDVVRHRYSLPANFLDDTQRGIDLLNPVWNVLDLLPDGRGEWYARNDYAGRTRG
jgi:predicted dithiol-disulfide oxidoreductase (DUF899 family)